MAILSWKNFEVRNRLFKCNYLKLEKMAKINFKFED